MINVSVFKTGCRSSKYQLNDGWEDLFVANGFITGDGPGDL